MASPNLYTSIILAAGIVFLFMFFTWKSKDSQSFNLLELESSLTESAKRLREELSLALRESVVLPQNEALFKKALNVYWAQQECEALPSCVFQPRNVEEVCTATKIISRHFDRLRTEALKENKGKSVTGLFAIRSGGHHHVSGAASSKGGVLIDLSGLDKVTIADDESTVTFGAGARWKQVYKLLEPRNLAVVGARNTDVGVGGFTLGGGYSFYSPQYGFCCSNITSYEIVLASGSAVTASATTNPDLWRALKGGSNNFGIVTKFTARTIPATKVWGGFSLLTYGQASKTLAAFHEYVNRVDANGPESIYDEDAVGPMLCFSYMHNIRLSAIALHMAHMKPPEDGSWPKPWKTSFKPIWRLWSSCKLQTHKSAGAELVTGNPVGSRQMQATTTFVNDPATLDAAHKVWKDAVADFRKANVKGGMLPIVFQPLLPSWICKGDPNSLGLENATSPLVLINMGAIWKHSRDDEICNALVRRVVEQIDDFANKNGTAHRYRFMNYASGWQNVLASYGEENLEKMRHVSRMVDPEGLFQRGCSGGFKLGMEYD